MFTNAAGLTLDNLTNLLTNSTITRSLWNTVRIAVPATVLVVIAALAAYAFAWVDFRGRTTLLVVIIVLLAVFRSRPRSSRWRGCSARSGSSGR